jgi:hypothetical protein
VAFAYSMSHALATEMEDPYQQKELGSCTIGNGGQGASGLVVTSHGFATKCVPPLMMDGKTFIMTCNNPDEATLLAQLKERGPLAVSIDALQLQHYDGGIFPTYACKHGFMDGDHAVVLVGYGEENGVKYWLMRNRSGPQKLRNARAAMALYS